MKKGDYVLIRSGKAGAFAGEFVEKNGTEVTLKNARKIYYWYGAKTVEDIAVNGIKRINNCKITVEVSEIIIDDVCQVLPVSPVAEKIIREAPIWTF